MSRAQQEKLYDAITGIREDVVEAAQETPLRTVKKAHWGRRVAVAACLCAAVGVGWGLSHLRMGASSGGGGGSDAEGTFMSYAGPVFPLTLTEAQSGLTAERDITLDFAGYESRRETVLREDGAEDFTYETWESDIRVTDEYTLTNSADEDVTVRALYPFAGSLRTLGKLRPEIRADGETVKTELSAGGYSGGFSGVLGGDGSDPGLYNLDPPHSWEGYRGLLADGTYQAGAFAPAQELTEPVTVYEFTGSQAPTEKYSAATLAVWFTIDPERTAVLTWGFNGMEWDQDTGYRRYSYFVEKYGGREQTRMLIIFGDDVAEYTLGGYENGACEKEIGGVSAVVTRRETTFGQLLRELTAVCREENARVNGEGDLSGVSDELLLKAVAGSVVNYANTIARYDGGRLDDVVSDAVAMARVFYLAFDVTVPAGGSVSVTAAMRKEPSMDLYHGGDSENWRDYGYDLVTRLGSNLTFTAQRAALVNTEWMEIVGQNFGFDPENGVTAVELDPAQEHYYLDVRRTVPET